MKDSFANIPEPGELRRLDLPSRRRLSAPWVLLGQIVALVFVVLFWFENFQWISLDVQVKPDEAASVFQLEREAGWVMTFGNSIIAVSSDASIRLTAEGYQPLTYSLDQVLNRPGGRALEVEMSPLPGSVRIQVYAESEYRVFLNGAEIENEQLSSIELDQGRYDLNIVGSDENQSIVDSLIVEGYGIEQRFEYDLRQILAEIVLEAHPSYAKVQINDVVAGTGKIRKKVAPGKYTVRVSGNPYRDFIRTIEVSDREVLNMGEIDLRRGSALFRIESLPDKISVWIDGEFKGLSPLEFEVKPRDSVELKFSKTHYHPSTQSLDVKPGMSISRMVELQPIEYAISVTASRNTEQVSANVHVEGAKRGRTPLEIALNLGDRIEVSGDGYQTQSFVVDSAVIASKSIQVEMVTPMEFAMNQAPAQYTSTSGITMIEFPPINYSRTYARPFQTRTSPPEVKISRPFYLSKFEVTIGEFLQYDPQANPNDEPLHLPIRDVLYTDAARFCNWLSRREGHAPVYIFDPAIEQQEPFSKPGGYRIIGADGTNLIEVDYQSSGYRLPTELEWEVAFEYDVGNARLIGPYPWGETSTVPLGVANLAHYAPLKSAREGFTIRRDREVVSKIAKVGTFPPNANGIHDMIGNVSEWVHDCYDHYHPTYHRVEVMDPSPSRCYEFVVKGSSFSTSRHDARPARYRRGMSLPDRHIGFRVARWID